MLKKGNWPENEFSEWEKRYIARRVIEYAGALTSNMFPSDPHVYGYPRRPKKDMPIRYSTGYLDEFSSYIIRMGVKKRQARLRDDLLKRMAERAN